LLLFGTKISYLSIIQVVSGLSCVSTGCISNPKIAINIGTMKNKTICFIENLWVTIEMNF